MFDRLKRLFGKKCQAYHYSKEVCELYSEPRKESELIIEGFKSLMVRYAPGQKEGTCDVKFPDGSWAKWNENGKCFTIVEPGEDPKN